MTIQILKDNKAEIISFITENFGAEYVKKAMQDMVENIDVVSSSDIEVYLNEFKEYFQDVIYEMFKPRKESKLASMMAKAHEDERYNMMTKDWEKI